MRLTRPLAVIDLEATDPDPATCSIFEYGVCLLMPDGTRKQGSMRFKPWKPITPKAIEVTGVTNEMVADCPPFSDYAEKIWKSLQGKDLAGYNIRRFDAVALDEEIRRATSNRLKLDLTGVALVDLFGIYVRKNPRKLEDCVRAYCGEQAYQEFLTVKHGAGPDSHWTLDALLGATKAHDDLSSLDIAALAEFSLREGDEDKRPVDLAGKLYRDKDGFVCYGFGKQKDRRVADDPGYAQWMLRSNFPGSTCDALREELERLDNAG